MAQKMAQKIDDFRSNTMVADPGDDTEMATSHLTNGLNGTSELSNGEKDQLDWLSRLKTQSITTGVLEDTLAQHWEPSGMAQHTAAPRMVPTIGARLSRKLRRTLLFAVVNLVAAGAVAGGAYVLYNTTWFSAVFEPQAQSAAKSDQPEQGAQAGAPLPDIAQGGMQPVIEAPVTGTAKELREQGAAQMKAGNYDEAIRLFETSTTLGGDAVTYYQLGLAYMAAPAREHALEDAEMAFRSAASLEPSWGAPLLGLAESLMRRGFYTEAIQPALQATRIDPKVPEAWVTLGRAYDGAGNKAESSKAFAEAARLAPAPLIKP